MWGIVNFVKVYWLYKLLCWVQLLYAASNVLKKFTWYCVVELNMESLNSELTIPRLNPILKK